MKIMKTILATMAIVAATATTAQARDSFSIGVNIGGHGHARHSIGTHRHAPAFRGYYRAPSVVYYAAPPVVYYAPTRRYNHFSPYASYGRQFTRDFHQRNEGRRGHSRRWQGVVDQGRRGERHRNRRGDGHRYGRR